MTDPLMMNHELALLAIQEKELIELRPFYCRITAVEGWWRYQIDLYSDRMITDQSLVNQCIPNTDYARTCGGAERRARRAIRKAENLLAHLSQESWEIHV